MKKIISLLVVLAMLMAVVPTAFADEPLSGSFLAAEGTNVDWTAPATGTATVSTGTGTGMLVVDEGSTLFTTGSGEFACVEGTTYQIKHFVAGGDMINWSVEVAGGAGGAETSGVLDIESYSYADWTAPQDGSVKFTISVAGANVAVLNGFTPLGEAADSVTVQVTAGTTYSIYPGYSVTTDCTVAWEYVEGGEGGEGGNQGGGQPVDTVLELGENDFALAANDLDGETFTYVAEQTGNLQVEVSALSYMFYGMAQTYDETSWQYFGNQFTMNVNGVDYHEHTATVAVTAGDTVTIAIKNNMGNEANGTFTLSYVEGGDQGGGNTDPEGSANNPYIIDSLPATISGTLSAENCWDGLFYQYTATEAGTITCTDGGVVVSCQLNGEAASLPLDVVVGDVVVLNPWAFEAGSFSFEAAYGSGQQGGGSTEPDGTSGNPYVIDEMPYTVSFYGGMDLYYTYTAPADGVITANKFEGALLSGSHDYELNPEGTLYTIAVAEGDQVTLNPWTMQAEISGDMTFTFVADGGQDGPVGPAQPVASGTGDVTATTSIQEFFTPTADGVLTVTISADPGYKVWVYENATDATVNLAQHGTSGTYEYPLEAGVEYRIEMIGYYDWAEAAATITYDITFAAQQIEIPPVEIEKSDVELALGENNVDLLENTIVSLFDFVPAEAGIYKFTVPAGVTLAQYGYAAWNLMETAEDGVLEVVATAAEQTIMIGLTADAASVNVTIEKTGDYEAPAPVTKLEYEPTVAVDPNFELPEGEMIPVDITEEQTVVYGNDGYFHLGSFDGPILYVNLNSDAFVLANMYSGGGAIQFLGAQFEDEGVVYAYDYLPMMSGNYYNLSLIEDYYPMNADLVMFFADYGIAQGWYTAGLSPFEAVNDGTVVPESAWLAFAGYIEGNNGTATDGVVIGGEEELNGWVLDSDGNWYYFVGGDVYTGWLQLGSTWYYLGADGVMATGWQFINGDWYYFQSSGAMATGWQYINGSWYYLKGSGAMATGWLWDGYAWYYLQSSGAMVTGWLWDGYAWYYLQSNGAMATGWQYINGAWYYFQSSGAMVTGWLWDGYAWYFLYENGAMATNIGLSGGWIDGSGVWHG